MVLLNISQKNAVTRLRAAFVARAQSRVGSPAQAALGAVLAARPSAKTRER